MDDKLHILNKLSELRVKKQEESRLEDKGIFLFSLILFFMGGAIVVSSYLVVSILFISSIISFNVFKSAKQEKLNISKDIKNLEERLYKENHDPS